jgi:putative protease
LLELDLPPIPLIASTQMHNHTPERIAFLEKVGFRRVILARELALEEIAAIRRATGVELESFVHGALCVSYSGQCYMSQAVAARSGNRGVCAQPCRGRYTLLDGRGRVIESDRHLLSLRDLCLIEDLPALVGAGVASFKIEGRYKEIEYVKNVTAAYSRALDAFIARTEGYRRASSGRCDLRFTPDPRKTFNRGYTRFFLHGGGPKVASLDTQKSIGEPVGAVTRLFRNLDIAFNRLLRKSSGRRRIGVEMDFAHDGDAVRLAVRDEDGHEAAAEAPLPFEPPLDPAKSLEQVRTRLAATGNTPFVATEIRVAGPVGFYPLSFLNRLKRDALEALARVRAETCPRAEAPLVPNDAPFPEPRLDYHANVLNRHARRFYERHGAEVVEGAFETLADPVGREVMRSRYCLLRELDACPRCGGARLLEEPLRIRDGGHTYLLRFDCEACRMSVILEKKQ